SVGLGGQVTVTSEANVGSFIVEATSATDNGIIGILEVTLSLEDPVVTTVVANGTNSIEIPAVGTRKAVYTATVLDQYGTEMSGETITWSLFEDLIGVRIDENTGNVTVNTDAEVGSFNVVATSDSNESINGSFEVALSLEDSVVTRVGIDGESFIKIPGNTTIPDNTTFSNYTANVKDQYGKIMSEETVVWSLNEPVKGVSLDEEKGIVLVTSGAREGNFTLVAASVSYEEVVGQKSITLSRAPPRVTSISIKGDSYVIIPAIREDRFSYEAKVWDQYGVEIKYSGVTWSLASNVTGVSINSQSGLVTVTTEASKGFFTVMATSTEDSKVIGEKTVEMPFDAEELASSSGSGGGGGSSASENYNNIVYKDYSIKYVTLGKDIVYRFPNVQNDIESVKFTPLKAAGQVIATIEILNHRSSLVDTSPPGNVYRNINIWVGDAKFNSGNYISSAEISFKVEKKWLTENNADPSSIRLYRYSSGSWSELQTSRIGTDVNYYYYRSRTPGFSPFAIVSMGEIPVVPSSEPVSRVAEDVIYAYDYDLTLSSVGPSDAAVLNSALQADPVKPFNVKVFFIGIVGILIIGSVLGYRSRKNSVVLSRYYDSLYAFYKGSKTAAGWVRYKLSSESIHKDYASLSGKLQNIREADYKSIYDRKIAEIKERQRD
ncbi:MAG: PGF-pre-PGF domain-containing protein, partial [Methanolobus sp.]|nr:PGF-pre-PGF domain-containing protein [Methanolobus sp.]